MNLFSQPQLLERATLDDRAAAEFRQVAQRRVFVDGASRVVLYARPDGHVLVDAVEADPSAP